MTNLWRRLRSATPHDRALAAEALGLLVAARVGLWILHFATVRRVFAAYARMPVRRARPADRVAWAVAAAARRLPTSFRDCLPVALAADAMLRRHGAPSELVIGVRPSGADGRPAAHAWVVSGRRVVAGSLDDLATYVPLTANQHGPTQALLTILRGYPLPWDRVGCGPAAFLAACDAEEISGLVYHQLRDTEEFGSWPAAVREALAEGSRAAVARELLAREELVRVLHALAAAGVRPLLFKGAALAYTLYPHPSLRPRCDTDALIREDDIATVRAALPALGYEAPVQCDGELLFRQFELGRADRFGVEHAFDFHWAISTQTAFAHVLTYEELAARAVPAPALAANARVPQAVDALLIALIHPAMHHKNERRLLWTYDVHLLASALDARGFEALVSRATTKRVAAVCAHGLGLAREQFGTAVPPAALESLTAVPLSGQPTAAYLAPARTWATETVANVRGLPRWRDRLRLLKEIAFPSPAYMLHAYGAGGLPMRKALLPALYLHRGVRGAWRVMTGRK